MRSLAVATVVLSLSALASDAPRLGAAPPPAAGPAAPAAAALPKGPVLTGEDGQPIKGVRLAKADVKAVVQGSVAQATMTLTFANDLPQVLGGELVFPLPEGATVTGYGLEINGVMVDGVAVEKQRARAIYEQELHKRVDPGLVEHVAGNAFRTRLYPVPANGRRSVKIEYVATVDPVVFDASGAGGKNGNRSAMTLPIGWRDVVDQADVRVEIRGAADAPLLAGAAGDQPGLKVERAGDGYVVAGTVPTAALGNGLTIVLPPMAAQSVAVEKRPKIARTIEEWDGRGDAPAGGGFEAFEHYFALTDTPAAAERKPPEFTNKRVAVIWDASLSRADVDHARELKVLQATLERFGHPAADLVILRNDVEVHPSAGGGPGGTGNVIAFLKDLAYDGATNLGGLPLPRSLYGFPTARFRNDPANYDFLLLFTDGLGNLGADAPKAAEVPVYAVANADRVNHTLLRSICQQSGGAYFNLARVSDDQVISSVGGAPFSIVSIDAKPNEIADVYPGPGAAVDGRITLAGRLLVPEAKVTVHYGYGKQVTASQTFTVKAGNAAEGTLLPRFWAQQKVAALSLAPGGGHDEELAKVGRQFNLVTPNTSLLVLETADQYVQYRVVPPPNRADVYKEFLAKIEQNKAQEQQTKEQKLQQVAAAWNARVQWWEQEYKYPANLKVPARAEGIVGATDAATPLALRANDATIVGAQPTAGANGQAAVPAAERRASLEEARTVTTAGRTPTPAPASPATDLPVARQQMAQAAAAPARPAAGPAAAQAGRDALPSTPALRPAAAPAAAAGSASAATDDRRGTARDRERDSAYAVTDLAKTIPDFTNAPDFDLQTTAGATRGPVFGAARAKKETAEGPAGLGSAAIQIRPWDPSTPYLAAMKAAPADRAYGVFLEQRKSFGRSPAFYLDCADYLVAAGQRPLGVRVLTDVAELQLQDARLLRVAAHRLEQIGERELAIDMFEQVLKLRPEEPQSYRDLALALADRADFYLGVSQPQRNWAEDAVARAASDYGRALELLNKVIVGNWPRFPEIELPVLMEANRIAAAVQRLPGVHDFHNPIDARLQKNLDCDVRVVMTWDADQTDIDLWVTEPSAEKCFYGHNRTTIGGLLSRDYTDGYGPEEYCLRKLMPGRYNVQANFYGSRQQELTGPATVQATVITDFGRPTEKRQALTLRLKDRTSVVDVGTVTLGNGAGNAEPAPQPGGAGELNK